MSEYVSIKREDLENIKEELRLTQNKYYSFRDKYFHAWKYLEEKGLDDIFNKLEGVEMSEPSGYLLHGNAFSSKEAAFEILVHNHEQELRFKKLWDEDAQPYYFETQPQLTIPKSIADELDDIFNEFVRIKNSRSIWSLLWRAEEIDYEIGEQLVALLPDENQVNIAVAYLAGKALGVDLVKVVEE